MRCSVLDLGSNSFHVLVADLDGATLVPVDREREMLHLGRVVAQHGGVPEPEIARAEATVAHLTALARRSGSVEHLAVATSALRDADNGIEVLTRLSDAAGTPVRTLSGEEEARLAYLGVRAAVAVAPEGEPVLVVDLGGGSLELAVGTGTEVAWSTSTPLGVSRLSSLVTDDPPRRRDLKVLRARVDDALSDDVDAVVRDLGPRTAVAVGGTVRALARVVAAEDAVWLPTTLNQLHLPVTELARVRDELTAMDLEARLAVAGMKERRADHLHIAAVVLCRALERLQVEEVVISDWGLREGMLLDAHGAATTARTGADLRASEVARLRTTFPTDDRHLDHLAALAGQLFDDLRDVHGLAPADRELLQHAARLHDVGETVALRRHPVHGAYLLTNAELRGFAPAEIAILATLVRFHRSRGIGERDGPFASLSAADQDRTRRLLPLLQIADRCDRTGDRRTREITTVRDHEGVTLEPVGAALPVAPLELARTEQLFERTFGVPLRFNAAVATATS
jgi:exopolyphosphatase / guanosine-5'-triphosphate,3'-diphosphate pyrophosphatase